MLPSVDELLALDALILREHTERAGDAFDVDERRVQLRKSMEVNEVCSVRREGKLVAYAMLRPDSGACWFVGAFGTHPSHRTYAVITELLAKIPFENPNEVTGTLELLVECKHRYHPYREII